MSMEPDNDLQPSDLEGDLALKCSGTVQGTLYPQADITVLRTLLDEPYPSTDSFYQGLLLHSVFHHPNGWDHVPDGQGVPCGESFMWGDYHVREAALLVQRLVRGEPCLTFFGCLPT